METNKIDLSSAPESPPRYSLSQQLWGVDWQSLLPWSLDTNVTASLANFDLIKEFMKKHGAAIYEVEAQKSAFLSTIDSPAKEFYYQNLADHFAFWQAGELVGVFTGNAFDWSTYYLRNFALLHKARGKGMQRKFYEKLFLVLKELGVERVEGEVSPSNLAQVHTFNKLEFNVVGSKMTERWGGLLLMTKYLQEKNQNVFLEQFCMGPKPQSAKNKRERRII